ncbi:MAG: HEAT repeat domain-containing protein [Phycisphaeraceae bacterium]|nr:HEAT repeat domain-containing protein [Phycisphaeraceae bacterium]
MERLRRWFIPDSWRAAALIAAAMCGTGCIDPDARRQMAESESILAPFFSQTSPIDAARWSVDPYDADKRARGTLLLANAPFGGGEPYLKIYRQHLSDEGPLVRAVSARALGLHGGSEDAELLLPLTADAHVPVRFEAVRALQRLHNPRVVTRLMQLLRPNSEPEPSIRAEAACALGQYAEPRVLDALIAALADDNLVVVANAHDSLVTLTGREGADEDRREWTAWAQQTREPFAGRREYLYPVFNRDKRWLDYLPFTPPVPNEVAGRPHGMPG